MPESAPARSITKSVAIDRTPGEVFAYLADARNWPQWSVVNVLAIEATSDPAWWKMTTPHGPGELRIRGDAATGLLDHDFRDPQVAWTVPALVDTELAVLKHILETRQYGGAAVSGEGAVPRLGAEAVLARRSVSVDNHGSMDNHGYSR